MLGLTKETGLDRWREDFLAPTPTVRIQLQEWDGVLPWSL